MVATTRSRSRRETTGEAAARSSGGSEPTIGTHAKRQRISRVRASGRTSLSSSFPSDKKDVPSLSISEASPSLQVLTSFDLLAHIAAFQPGRKYADWRSGDNAIRCGHLALLKLKEAEAASRVDRDILPLFYGSHALSLAISKGNMTLLQWLHCHPVAEEKAFFASLASQVEPALAEPLIDLQQSYKVNVLIPRGRMLRESAAGHASSTEILSWLEMEYPHSQASFLAYQLAAECGNLDNLRWMCARRPLYRHEQLADLMEIATTSADYIEIVKWLAEEYDDVLNFRGPRWSLPYVVGAGLGLDTLRWLTDRYGSLIVEYHGIEDEDYADYCLELDGALFSQLETGRLDKLSWLFQRPECARKLSTRLAGIMSEAMDLSDCFEVMEWAERLINNREVFDNIVKRMVFPVENLLVTQSCGAEGLRWLYEKYPQWRSDWLTESLVSDLFNEDMKRDLDALQWLHSLRCMPEEDFFSLADIPKLVMDIGRGTRLEDTFGVAMMKWLHKVRPQLLQEAYSPRQEDIQEISELRNCREVLECFVDIYGEAVCTMIDFGQALETLSTHGSLDSLKYLQGLYEKAVQVSTFKIENSRHGRGLPCWREKVVRNAALQGDLAVLEFLYEHGYDLSCTKSITSDLAKRDRLSVIAFLCSKKAIYVTKSMLDTARLRINDRSHHVFYWLARSASSAVLQEWLSSLSARRTVQLSRPSELGQLLL